MNCYRDEDAHSRILGYLEIDPIPWFDEEIFSAKALNIISSRLLTTNLPCYKQHPHKLRNSIHVPGELSFSLYPFPIKTLVCGANLGYLEMAHAVSTIATTQNDSSLMTVRNPITAASEWGSLLPSQGYDKADDRLREKGVLVLYLNQGVLEHNDHDLTFILKCAIDQEVEIILIHAERDPTRNVCDFWCLFPSNSY